MNAGRIPEAIDALRQALALKPGDEYSHSNLLLNLCYSPAHSGEALRKEAEIWANVHAPAGFELPPVDVAPRKRLRIGYRWYDANAGGGCGSRPPESGWSVTQVRCFHSWRKLRPP